MKVSEVPATWQSLNCLVNHFTESDKQIIAVFQAPADQFIASEVYRLSKDGYRFPLFPQERNNPYAWVAFRDKSVQLLSDLLQDEWVVKVLNDQGIHPVSLIAEDTWSEYVSWPRGFDIWLSYSRQPLQLEVQDEATGETISQTISIHWRDTIRLNYRNGYPRVNEMKKPRIRFKAAELTTSDISIVFQAPCS